jgi:K+-sensing histidine kinase KdpD
MKVSKPDQGELMERIARRDRQRAEFVATVSHDLKTPLNGIVGFTSVLLAEANKRDDQEQVHKLQLVFDSAKVMLERINALVGLYRMEAGRIQVSLDWLLPEQVMRQVVESIGEKMNANEVSIKLQLADAPKRIQSDVSLMASVLNELLANAVRFGKAPWNLALNTRDVDEDGFREVVFSISDQGPGLPADKRQSFQLALGKDVAPLDRDWSVLGLGLALAQQAASLLQGWIEVDHPEKGGCVFSLVLRLPDDQVET